MLRKMLKMRKKPEYFRFRCNLTGLVSVLYHVYLSVLVLFFDVADVVLICLGS
jgi:hypothetical protein